VRRLFNALADALIALFGLARPWRPYRAFAGRIDVRKRIELNGVSILFDANEELHLLRAQWLETKEPETLAWIHTFKPGEVFYDIGANVGVFSLYAALRAQSAVWAFEPEAKNYACLNRNILLNGLARRVRALNLGLHDRTGVEFLNLHDLASGAALHALGEPVDWRKARFEPKFEQAVLAYTLDELVERFALPAPAHVKLDVDGNERRIIQGGRKTFSSPTTRSLLIEINENDRELIAMIEDCGLKTESMTRANLQGAHTDTCNAVFRRPG
jgi:FkbM family methyltransferase